MKNILGIEYLQSHDVANILKISEKAVSKLFLDGEIKADKIGKDWLTLEVHVNQYLIKKENKHRVYSFANFKGGVGKTTACLNCGVGLARQGYKVLLIDFDPQSSLTSTFNCYGETSNINDALLGDADIKDCIIENVNDYENLHLIPSHLDLSATEISLSATESRGETLKKVITPIIQNYDFILIDCPPMLGYITVNALTASTHVFIAVQPEGYALQGLSRFLQVLKTHITDNDGYNPDLVIGGIIVTKFKGIVVNQKVALDYIKKEYPNLLLNSLIRESVAISEAVISHKDIFAYDPKSKPAKDYAELVNEIIKIKG